MAPPSFNVHDKSISVGDVSAIPRLMTPATGVFATVVLPSVIAETFPSGVAARTMYPYVLFPCTNSSVNVLTPGMASTVPMIEYDSLPGSMRLQYKITVAPCESFVHERITRLASTSVG